MAYRRSIHFVTLSLCHSATSPLSFPMHFNLVDRVIEQSADRIVTIKHVSSAEEYLQDHFATFPVLPGVLMLEAMVQAARRLAGERLVLARVRALKYGRFVRPGATLRVEVTAGKETNGERDFRGECTVIEPEADVRPALTNRDGGPLAASGRFALRPVRLGTPIAADPGPLAGAASPG